MNLNVVHHSEFHKNKVTNENSIVASQMLWIGDGHWAIKIAYSVSYTCKWAFWALIRSCKNEQQNVSVKCKFYTIKEK